MKPRVWHSDTVLKQMLFINSVSITDVRWDVNTKVFLLGYFRDSCEAQNRIQPDKTEARQIR
jgi:hypothetical protein